MEKLSEKLSAKWLIPSGTALEPRDIIAAVRALENELEQVRDERDEARAECVDRAATEASLAQNLYDCIGERDALAAKLEKSRALFLRLNTAADSQLSHDLSAEGVNLCCSAQMPCPAPSGTSPKTEQQEANEVKQECAHCARLAEIGQPPASGHHCPSDWSAHPRATTPVSGSSMSQPSTAPFRVTGPGFYRQRDGGKAEVAGYNSEHEGWNGRYADEPQAPIDMCWYKDGRASHISAQDPYDLVAPWVEHAPEAEEFDVVEREVVLWRNFCAEGLEECTTAAQFNNIVDPAAVIPGSVARATVQFKVPRPAKPKVTASVTFHDSANDYLVQMPDAPLVGQPGHMREGIHKYITREQAIALRDALVAAKLDGEGEGK